MVLKICLLFCDIYQRCFDIHLTSITFKIRRIDVQITSCVNRVLTSCLMDYIVILKFLKSSHVLSIFSCIMPIRNTLCSYTHMLFVPNVMKHFSVGQFGFFLLIFLLEKVQSDKTLI